MKSLFEKIIIIKYLDLQACGRKMLIDNEISEENFVIKISEANFGTRISRMNL